MTPKSVPGMVLGNLGAPCGVLRAIFKEFLCRLARRWAKLGPSWEQVATKLGQDSAKLAILGSTWEVLGAFWDYCGTWAG